MPVTSSLSTAPTFSVGRAGVIPTPFNSLSMLATFMQGISSALTYCFARTGEIPTAFCPPAVLGPRSI